jgi:zinc protease
MTRVLPIVAALALAIPCSTAAQPPAAAPQAPAIDLQAPIPFDGAVQTGTLPNGLTYYVRHNGRPANRVALRSTAARTSSPAN